MEDDYYDLYPDQDEVDKVNELLAEVSKACHAMLDYMTDINGYVYNHPDMFGVYIDRATEICEKVDNFKNL